MPALTLKEIKLIEHLRTLNPAESIPSYQAKTTLGERLADRITALVGSWHFLITQSVLLIFWIGLNIAGYIKHWDPYPFILLNLALSFQAAYTAPVIMMSQNRELQVDRAKLEYYYNVNIKQELEIELLHHKMDALLKKLDVSPEHPEDIG